MISWDDAISAVNALIREFPTSADIEKIVEELATGHPRAAAIVGAAMMEAALKRAVLFRLRKLNSEEHAALFGPDNPLGSFSGKIKIGYALGIYERPTRKDLDSIRTIRNAFAHANLQISFDTPEIETLCSMFRILRGLPDHDIWPADKITARERYLGAIRHIIGELAAATPDLDRHDASPDTPPEQPSSGSPQTGGT